MFSFNDSHWVIKEIPQYPKKFGPMVHWARVHGIRSQLTENFHSNAKKYLAIKNK
jgi:hypothetical protein